MDKYKFLIQRNHGALMLIIWIILHQILYIQEVLQVAERIYRYIYIFSLRLAQLYKVNYYTNGQDFLDTQYLRTDYIFI